MRTDGMVMHRYLIWFNRVLEAAFQLYFHQECAVGSVRELPPPPGEGLEGQLGISRPMTFDERIAVLLALMPHVWPQCLDIFFASNRNFGRSYTEFGGWKGTSHGGFLPTGETAVFILAGEDFARRREVFALFRQEHWFYTSNILWLEGQGPGEPFLSGRLQVSEEVLTRVMCDVEYKPDYSPDFPAKRLTTALEWKDVVLDYRVRADILEIDTWIREQKKVMEEWGLGRFLKAGYRALFYGPPGTGKTLTASLIGKSNRMDVYRIDLSLIVSKYIGETEKNLARVFDLAENRNWILFFDEADALFGKRTATDSTNDRYANQEVAYLLQRVEDFPGTILLATNLKTNIDEAFSRRFQSVVYFPMPDEELRTLLWRQMLPADWLGGDWAVIGPELARYELSGGAISNVIRRCALQLIQAQTGRLTRGMLETAIRKELFKEGKM